MFLKICQLLKNSSSFFIWRIRWQLLGIILLIRWIHKSRLENKTILTIQLQIYFYIYHTGTHKNCTDVYHWYCQKCVIWDFRNIFECPRGGGGKLLASQGLNVLGKNSNEKDCQYWVSVSIAYNVYYFTVRRKKWSVTVYYSLYILF